MEKVLVNKVANSGLITINLEEFYPKNDIVQLDITEYLFHGLILKEKDFRQSLKEIDWSVYQNKHLCIFCSADAIIPTWAYMLVTSYAADHATTIYQGTEKEFLSHYYNHVLESVNYSSYQDQRLIIKGCSNKPVPPAAYAALTKKLKPIALSIMYGEPCSTVPIYKRPRKK